MANQVQHRPNGAGAIMQQSALFDQLPAEWDDLTANVAISFPILGIKGGKWHYRFRGEESILLTPRSVPYSCRTGRHPQGAEGTVSYVLRKRLRGGRQRPPDCWSSDGVAPDSSVAQPINPVCATCPCDAWGSGATPAAPKAKACQQRRRTVVVPYSADLTNEAGGGPILLSVPPGSLTNQVAYGNMLRDNRVHYAGIVTELSVHSGPLIAFPKIEFNYVRSLNDDEARVIIEMRGHEQVDRILSRRWSLHEMEAPRAVEGCASRRHRSAAAPRSASAATDPRPQCRRVPASCAPRSRPPAATAATAPSPRRRRQAQAPAPAP